ncbi:MAG TPA: pilus assembly protein PilM [Gammaproteobacteria bacterium]|nr:pilus assembly protein PilM [Gammaproteobacteria bacterium]
MGIFAKRRTRAQQTLALSHHDEGCALAVIDHATAAAPALVRAEWFAGDPARSAALLARHAREHRLGRVSCVSLIEPNDYSLVLVDTPEVPPAELRAAMRWRVKELIDFHIDDAVIDVFDVPTEDGRAARRMYAVAARSERVQRAAAAAQGAGLALEVVDIPEFALRNLAVRLPEDGTGVALIHFEARHGLLTVGRRGALYFSRRLDGGRERLLHAGPALTPAMEGQLDALTIEIQRSLDFYERHFAQPSIGAIVLAGLPQPVAGMPDYLQSQLGVATRWLDFGAILRPSIEIPQDLLARCTLAIGAALRRPEHAA